MAWIKKYNILTWAVSLVIAVALWGYVSVMLDPVATRTVSGIAVEFEGEEYLEGRNLMLTGNRNQTISAAFTGHLMDMQKLNAKEMRVIVPLQGVQSWGELYLPCTLDGAPLGLEVRYPETVTVNIDQVETVEVPLSLDLKAAVAQGYLLRTEIFDPAMINVRGPKRILNVLSKAVVTYESAKPLDKTVALDTSYIFYNSTLDPLDPLDLSLLSYAPDVRLTIPIAFTKELPVGLNFMDGGGITQQNLECTYSQNVVTVSGESDVLAELESLILGTVDLAALPGDTSLKYPVVLPEGVTNETGVSEIEAEIKIVGVSARKVKVEESLMTVLAGTLPEGYQVQKVTEAIHVTVRGAEKSVTQIKPSNIRVVLDLSGIPRTAGTYTVEPTVSLDGFPDAGVVRTKDDYMVTVRLTPVEG